MNFKLKTNIMGEQEEQEGKKFWNKYGFLIVIAGIAVFFTILKLIGFPEILMK